MTELKTLKDLIQGTELGDAVNPHELKEEAIKWIKAIEDSADKTPILTFINGKPIIDWIKLFFNITQGDLK